jgi:hypothetical protein
VGCRILTVTPDLLYSLWGGKAPSREERAMSASSAAVWDNDADEVCGHCWEVVAAAEVYDGLCPECYLIGDNEEETP